MAGVVWLLTRPTPWTTSSGVGTPFSLSPADPVTTVVVRARVSPDGMRPETNATVRFGNPGLPVRVSVAAPDGALVPVTQLEGGDSATVLPSWDGVSWTPFATCGPDTDCEADFRITLTLTRPERVDDRWGFELFATFPHEGWPHLDTSIVDRP